MTLRCRYSTSRNLTEYPSRRPPVPPRAAPGTQATYDLTVTNNGCLPDTVWPYISGYDWATSVSPALLDLEPGASGSFTVTVNVPAGAPGGSTDTADVILTSQGDHSKSAVSVLTTTADPTISASAGSGGTINPSGEVVVDYGADQAFDITPDPGWHVDDVLVDGISQRRVTEYPFQDVTEDHTIAASFASDLSVWYLAEGSTDWGFDCYVSVVNPNDEAVEVEVTYMTSTGPVAGPTVHMPADLAGHRVSPRPPWGPRTSPPRWSARRARPSAWTGPCTGPGAGAPCPEAHCATGVTAPATTWYMPEGSSAWGFECWLLIQNPNAAATDATVTYMIEGGGPQTSDLHRPRQLPGHLQHGRRHRGGRRLHQGGSGHAGHPASGPCTATTDGRATTPWAPPPRQPTTTWRKAAPAWASPPTCWYRTPTTPPPT